MLNLECPIKSGLPPYVEKLLQAAGPDLGGSNSGEEERGEE
jgi:hypothetical protein